MNINKPDKLHIWHLIAAALLISSLGVSSHKVSGQSRSTDTELERRLASIMKNAPGQRRRSLTYNAILARVARQRAYDMGRRNYLGHVNPDGIGPNYLVTRAGYVLPEFYEKNISANNIEDLVGGSETPEEAWDDLMNSPPHRSSLLGLTKFSAETTEYGIGHAYVPDSYYKHYWVIITATPGGRNNSSPSSFPDWLFPKERDGRAAAAAPRNRPSPATSTTQRNNSAASTAFPDFLIPKTRTNSASRYPNVVRRADGKLEPASGYVWASDDTKDLRVKLMRGLLKTADGNFRPARGYKWANPNNPKDLRVKPVP